MAKRKNKNMSFKRLLSVVITTLIVACSSLATASSRVKLPFDFPNWNEVFDVVDAFLTDPEQKKLPTKADGELMVTIIDVGQGESILIQTPNQNVLIDAGENGTGKTVTNYIKSQNVDEIDLMIGTHPHSDHIGGMDYVINNVKTDTVLMPHLKSSIIPTTKTYKDVLKAIDNNNVKLVTAKVGQVFDLGSGAVLSIYGPVKDYDSLNNSSIVSRLDFGETSFLFTGDAEIPAEKDILKTNADIDVDVLNAGHHGSRTSSGKEYFDKVSPKYVCISCGQGNDYGHPHKETINRLEQNNIPYNRTDLNGNITYITDGNDIEIVTER